MDGITVNESILVELLVGWGITDERNHLNPKDFGIRETKSRHSSAHMFTYCRGQLEGCGVGQAPLLDMTHTSFHFLELPHTWMRSIVQLD
jgi:hypothetical protein